MQSRNQVVEAHRSLYMQAHVVEYLVSQILLSQLDNYVQFSIPHLICFDEILPRTLPGRRLSAQPPLDTYQLF